MEAVTDLAMNTGVLMAMNYSGLADTIENATGNSAVGISVGASVVANLTKVGASYLHSWGIFPVAPSYGTPHDVKQYAENVAVDSVSMFALYELGAYDKLSQFLPSDELASKSLKQGVIISGADLITGVLRKTNIISGLESRMGNLY